MEYVLYLEPQNSRNHVKLSTKSINVSLGAYMRSAASKNAHIYAIMVYGRGGEAALKR